MEKKEKIIYPLNIAWKDITIETERGPYTVIVQGWTDETHEDDV